MNVVIAFGNPLLDTSVSLAEDDTILDIFNLKKDDQKEINEVDMKRLLKAIENKNKSTSPGGCAQNTLRVMQWLFRHQFSATIVGAIGNDESGAILRSLLEKDGVQTNYIVHNNYPTGTTVALISGVYRTLVAHLGAAEHLSSQDLPREIFSLLDTADLIYLEGFFLTKRSQVARMILETSREKKKMFAFNISGRYLCDVDPTNVVYFAKNCDILFGNRKEFESLRSITKSNDLNSLIRDFLNSHQSKVIVMTDGGRSVTCGYNGGKIKEIRIPEIERSDIVDTTGAGDAFVGGFLAGWILRRCPTNCVELGCYAAQEIIKKTGCTLPSHQPNVLL